MYLFSVLSDISCPFVLIFHCFHNKLPPVFQLKTMQIILLLTHKFKRVQLMSLIHVTKARIKELTRLECYLVALGKDILLSYFEVFQFLLLKDWGPYLVTVVHLLNVSWIPWLMTPFIFVTNNGELSSYISISLTSHFGLSLRAFSAFKGFMWFILDWTR